MLGGEKKRVPNGTKSDRALSNRTSAELKVYDTLNLYLLKQLRHISGKRVLDIGCSTGRLGAVLKEHGNAVFGIEQNPEAAAIAAKVIDDVAVGNFEHMKIPFRQGFDVVVMGDVLEHMKEPGRALLKAAALLKHGGILVVSVPNIANWLVRLKILFGVFDYADRGIMDDSHLRFFTMKSISRIISGSGVSIRKVDIYPSFPPFFMRFPLLRDAAYLISSLRKQLFAFQFIVVGEKK